MSREIEDGMGFAGLVGGTSDERELEKHVKANRVLVNKNVALERELRLAMSFISHCPHHVFKYPKEVIDFWERNIAYAPDGVKVPE